MARGTIQELVAQMKTKTIIDSKMIRVITDPMTPGTLSAMENPKWEYKSVLLDRRADLNPFGADGWELVSVSGQGADQMMFYFRRRKF